MNNTVYLSNLSYQRDKSGIRTLVAKFGTVKNIKIVVDPKTDVSKGMAFVEMGSPAEAKKVIENLDGKIVDGRTLKAKPATPLKNESAVPFKEPFREKKAPAPKKVLTFKDKQLSKKAKNDAKRKSNPLVFKKSSR